MTTEAILFGVSCSLLYVAVTFWIQMRHLRAMVRRVAEHLGNECHVGIKNIDTHRALWAECEREGWDEKGGER